MPRSSRRHPRLRGFLARAGGEGGREAWTGDAREALVAFLQDFVARAGAHAGELPGRQVGLAHAAAGALAALPSARHAEAAAVMAAAVAPEPRVSGDGTKPSDV